MCAGSQTDVRSTRPVHGVVSRVTARTTEVGHLVMLEAGPLEELVGVEILALITLVAGLAHQATVAPSPERGSVLGGEAVEGNVRRLERERRVQIALPGALELVRKCEDQVDGDVVEASGARALDRA